LPNFWASFISYLTRYQLSFPNAFIGNLVESALTAGFSLNKFAGMASGRLGMNQHSLKYAKFWRGYKLLKKLRSLLMKKFWGVTFFTVSIVLSFLISFFHDYFDFGKYNWAGVLVFGTIVLVAIGFYISYFFIFKDKIRLIKLFGNVSLFLSLLYLARLIFLAFQDTQNSSDFGFSILYFFLFLIGGIVSMFWGKIRKEES
jgi:hypothetical protein